MPLSAEIRRRIVEAGILAPSGDNLQAWLIHWEGSVLSVAVDPNRDRSLYNFRFRASLIALGGLIENIIISASQFGLTAVVRTSPPDVHGLVTATLTFSEERSAADSLFPAIAQRCTNRRPYRRVSPEGDALAAMRKVAEMHPGAELHFIETFEKMRTIARAASLNDRVLFELKQLHDGFFETIRWTRAEAERTGDGLLVDTLELGPIAMSFKASRWWPVVRTLNWVGMSRLAPFHSFRTFMRSGAFAFLQMSEASPQSFLDGGRVLQRLWLTGTGFGLSIQPMAGMLYLLPYLRVGEAAELFPPAQRNLLVTAERLFKDVLPLDDSKAAIMLFRFGYGPKPSAFSLRRSLSESML